MQLAPIPQRHKHLKAVAKLRFSIPQDIVEEIGTLRKARGTEGAKRHIKDLVEDKEHKAQNEMMKIDLRKD